MGKMWLDISGENASPFEVELRELVHVIGRSAEADVNLQGQNISRKHAEVARDSLGDWVIRDLESRNGTYVNGERIAERPLVSGDVCRIGDFRLRVRSETPTDGPGEPGSEVTLTADVTISGQEDPFASIKRLEEFASPKIDANHHALLTEYSQQVVRVEDASERRRQLCELVVNPAFHGRQSLALRLKRSDPNGALQPLCEPQVSDERWRDEAPHVSRSLLRAVMNASAPLMASNAAADMGAVDISVSINIDEMAAIACPIRETDEYVDMLYVSFPAMYGTGEWLLLVSLAAKAYQQAETNAYARQQALVRAAMEVELNQAQRVQMSLVPKQSVIDSIEGFDIGILFRPCKWVGGDYVDVLPMPDGRVLFTLIDVSGKGMGAALVTMMLHTMVHTHAKQGSPLADMVHAMDQHLCEHLRAETFATGAFAAIDPATGEIECVNLGHPPGFVVNRAGDHRSFDLATNLPLGIDAMPCETGSDVLAPGEVYCLYSDGISEMQTPEGRWWGMEPIAEEVAAHYALIPDLPIVELVAQMQTRFNQIEPEERASDDRSMLIVKRLG